MSRNASEADDLTQQTLERAWRARSQWNAGTSLEAWLVRIMRNLWIDERRARSRAEQILREEPAGDNVGHDPRAALDAGLELASAMRAMQRLPDDQREAVSLVLIEGFSYDEAARITGTPIGTLSSRLVRGRAALLALLGGA